MTSWPAGVGREILGGRGNVGVGVTEAVQVRMILWLKEGGGIVLAQDPWVGFEAAAPEAMRKEGAPVYPAFGLAKQVATRWPA